MKTVWILFSVANEYNQPEKAFERLWWNKPTYDDLKEYGFTEEECEDLTMKRRYFQTTYWVESFTEM